MWLGNPPFLDPPHYPLADWSDFRVDYVRVTAPAAADADHNGVYDGAQAWTPKNVPPSSQVDSDGDGLPDSGDASNSAPGTIVIHEATNPAGDPAAFGFSGAITATLHDGESSQRSVAAGAY